MIPFPSENLFEQRTLVFIEEGPQSNKYRQLLLTKDQFRILSNTIVRLFEKQERDDLKPGHEVYEIEMSDELYDLPDLNTNI